ncbi:MAG: hypothetical protein ACO3RB_01585 [Ilumatobacteraceae bacterium]|jgi:hypothetical protein
MRRHRAAALATAAIVVVPWLAAMAAAAPATVDTTIPPEDTFVFAPEDTVEGGGFVDSPDESTTTSTTTTLPSAVTTVPPGCPTAPLAQAVFVGTAMSRDETSVVFAVDQLRAGALDAFVREGRVTVRYGGDARFVETGRIYIVGATVADPAAQVLQSTIRDEAVVIGEPEGLAVGPVCPEFEEVARTLNDDGTAVEASSASVFFSEPWRVIAAVALPALMVLALLVGAVFARRGLVR